jgi:subtilisin family serine protease
MRAMWRLALGWIVLIGCAWAQTLTPNDVVPGEILLTMRPGTAIEKARALASSITADLRPIGVPDTYVLRLRNQQGVASDILLQRVQHAIDRIKTDPDILYVRPHLLLRPYDVPNDPRFGEQWALTMVRAPEAWDTEKGQAGIRIAIIDTNFDRNHPDLTARYDRLSRNFEADPPNEDINPGPGAFSSHGTAVMGVAAASTNNGIGIAGLCWEGVTVVALKTSSFDFGLPTANILRAMRYIIDNAQDGSGNQLIHVLNMSFGSYVPDPQMNNLIQEMFRRGVVPVGAAGNDETDMPSYPDDYENVVRVSAVGPDGTKASYSNYGRIDLAAPGGDTQAGRQGGVLSTEVGGRYEYTEGTSFAAPYVSAAIALVLSAGVRVHRLDDAIPPAVEILQETANPMGRAVPDPELGWGIIDVGAAMRGLSGASITILNPVNNSFTDTKRVRIHVVVRRSTLTQIRLFFEGEEIPRAQWQPFASVSADGKTITIIGYELVLPGEGRFQFTVTAVGQDGSTSTTTSNIIVRPRLQPAGLAMFATPYRVDRTPEELFGADAILARYLPSQGRYARYSGSGVREPEASFNPPGVNVRPEGSAIPTPPRGLGYFLRTNTPAFILGDEYIDPNTAYMIPLEPGWNMIGNPFPYAVPWSACEIEVEGQAGVRQRLSILEAADKEYIRPQIYRYIGLTGEYTWRTAPLGELLPWQAHWLRVLKPCTLIVPPLGTGRSRSDESDNPRVAAETRDGWLLRLIARSGDREDANNFIGTSSRARDELSSEDVEKPPAFQSYVQLRVIEPRSRAALAQDLRRAGKRTMRWELDITTDKPNAEVTLHWQQEVPLPPGMRLTLVDSLTGQRISMNRQSAYTFRTDESSRRRFVVEVQPARLSQLRITQLNVLSTRGHQVTIQYALNTTATVQVMIQDATGRTLARLTGGTRSAGLNSATWNGRTDEGVAVPPGTYQIQIIATSEEGEVARAVRPLLITR